MDVTPSPFLFQETVGLFSKLVIQMLLILFQHRSWPPKTCSIWGYYWHGRRGSVTQEERQRGPGASCELSVWWISIFKTQTLRTLGRRQQAASSSPNLCANGTKDVWLLLPLLTGFPPSSIPPSLGFQTSSLTLLFGMFTFSLAKSIGKKWFYFSLLGFENEKKTNFANKCTKALLFRRLPHLPVIAPGILITS